MEYRFSVDGFSEIDYDDAYIYDAGDNELDYYNLQDKWELRFLAHACAAQFFKEHRGQEMEDWNNSEPLRFCIWIDEESYVTYDIYVDYDPIFTALLTS